ncbi:periplasmic binding protein-like I [Blastocladiella britannica]|nr:periplasmic binding protein-like I [Blastocladiella britannica]
MPASSWSIKDSMDTHQQRIVMRLGLCWMCVVLLAPPLAWAINFKIAINVPYQRPVYYPQMEVIHQFMLTAQPHFLTLDPTGEHTFEFVSIPTNRSQLSATLAARQAMADPTVVGIVGDASSGFTQAAALAGSSAHMWTCSGSSTSRTLSDKSVYPYFARTCPDDPQQGAVMAYFIQSMGWTSAALFSSSDDYGLGVTQIFSQKAQSLGIVVATSHLVVPGQINFTRSLQSVARCGSRIVVMALTPVGYNGIYLLQQARDMGMLDPQWVWLGFDGWNSVLPSSLAPQDLLNMNGMGVVAAQEQSDTPQYLQAAATWAAAGYSGTPLANSLFFLDCAYLIAHGVLKLASTFGAANVISRNYPATLDNFLPIFNGSTGLVQLDSLGNRYSRFTIANWYNGRKQDVFRASDTGQRFTPIAPFIFASGTSKVPIDREPPVNLNLQWQGLFGVVFGVMHVAFLAGIVAISGYLIRNRHEHAVKAMSLPFLLIISVGCTFVLASNLNSVGIPTRESCTGSMSLFLLGAQLVVSSSTAKAHRLRCIFSETQALVKAITTRQLMVIVGVFVGVQGCIVAGWSYFSTRMPTSMASMTTVQIVCANNTLIDVIFLSVSCLYLFVNLVVLVVLAYRTRNVLSTYRESGSLFFSSLTLLLGSIIIIPFAAVDFGSQAKVGEAARLLSIWVTALMVFVILVARVAIVAHRTKLLDDPPSDLLATVNMNLAENTLMKSFLHSTSDRKHAKDMHTRCLASPTSLYRTTDWRPASLYLNWRGGHLVILYDDADNHSASAPSSIAIALKALVVMRSSTTPRVMVLSTLNREYLIQTAAEAVVDEWVAALSQLPRTTRKSGRAARISANTSGSASPSSSGGGGGEGIGRRSGTEWLSTGSAMLVRKLSGTVTKPLQK